VELNGGGLVESMRENLVGFVAAVHGFEHARFGLEILEALFSLNGLIFPLKGLFEFVVIVEAPVGGFVKASPGEAADVAKLIFDAAKDDGLDINADPERNGGLVPAESGVRGVWLGVVEGVGECFAKFGSVRLDGNAKRIFLLVVRETAPGSGVLGEDDSP